MKNSINYLSKLSFLTISIFSFLIIVSCSKDGATGPAGSNGTSTTGATAASVFAVTSIATNTFSNYIFIDNPATNSNPNAIMFVTHKFTTITSYLNKSVGVFYSESQNKWAVYLEDQSLMPRGIQFNILVYNP